MRYRLLVMLAITHLPICMFLKSSAIRAMASLNAWMEGAHFHSCVGHRYFLNGSSEVGALLADLAEVSGPQ